MTYVIAAVNTLVVIWVMLSIISNANMFFVSIFGARSETQYALALNMASSIFNTSIPKEILRTGAWVVLSALLLKLGTEFGAIVLAISSGVQLVIVLLVKYMTYRQAILLEEQYEK